MLCGRSALQRMSRIAQTLWTGLRLRCPDCGVGRLYTGLRRHKSCTSCGALFERSEEGDFLVTVVVSYSITAVLIAAFVFLLNWLAPELDIYLQVSLSLALGLGFVFATYRNVKGLSVALLHLTFGLSRSRNGMEGPGDV